MNAKNMLYAIAALCTLSCWVLNLLQGIQRGIHQDKRAGNPREGEAAVLPRGR